MLTLHKLRSKKLETRDGGHVFDQGIQGSLASWNKLPKAPDQEVILLKKARGGRDAWARNIDEGSMIYRTPFRGEEGSALPRR